MAETVRIHGLDEVRRALRRLPQEVRRKELNKALRPGARLIANTAKSMAPRGQLDVDRSLRGKAWQHRAGQLAKSVAVRTEKKKYLTDDAKLKVGVLSSKRDPNIGAWYWRFVEFGTSKMPARPFLTPAFEQSKYAANRLIQKALLEGVRRQANKVRGR